MQQPIEGTEVTISENEPGTAQTASEPNTASPNTSSTTTPLATTSLATTSLKGALALIDQGLGSLTDRQLVSATEVTDLLLDVRSLLVAPA